LRKWTDMAMGENWNEIYEEMKAGEREERKEDLMYLFIDETDMDVEEVYSLVFMEGRKISWH